MNKGHIFLKHCEFVLGAAAIEGLPPALHPEIAFAGRSNVGKSSLINALTGRKSLVKASNTPGRTREINFFNLTDALMLVDLPGYGYAKAPGKEVKNWTRLVRDYLAGRPNLMRACLLIDSRHGLKDSDHDIMTLLDKAAVSYQLILTKTDKIKPSELKRVADETQAALKRHPAAHPRVFSTSSETREGIEALREELAGFARAG